MGLGYILMSGGGSDDPNVFSDAIFNTQRLTIGPILILAGLVIEIFRYPTQAKRRLNGQHLACHYSGNHSRINGVFYLLAVAVI